MIRAIIGIVMVIIIGYLTITSIQRFMQAREDVDRAQKEVDRTTKEYDEAIKELDDLITEDQAQRQAETSYYESHGCYTTVRNTWSCPLGVQQYNN
ncbi:MAG: hypothetical protein ACR2IS_07125 [Nitrososphaeraceae archaeon]